jgi:beta-galactosidase
MTTPLARILTLIALLFTVSAANADTRLDQLLPDGWKFIQSDAGPTASTDAWQPVTIPHTWNTKDADAGDHKGDPNFKFGYFRGPCWYARTLDIPAAWNGKRIFIRFEAASLVSHTYINGHDLGEHRGAFTAFCYELTPFLHPGANDLRVQVDNTWQPDIPPLSGDFNIDGGIYRPVHLIVTDQVCISPLNMASPGVYLTAKSITDSSAEVEVKTLLSNYSPSLPFSGPAPKDFAVKIDISDATGNIVATSTQPAVVELQKTGEILSAVTIPAPHLWNARKDPYLYTATVSILSGNKVTDSIQQPLGIRTVSISEDKGFLLNGQPYPIHGVNRHQDWGSQGWAASPENIDEDMQMMLDMGVTAIRLTHYPQSDYIHNLADHNGILLWNEVSLVNYISDSPAFAANAEQQLRELILQRYNHPSVAFWGLFNELDNTKGPLPEPLLNDLKSIVQQLDPTRIIVSASDHLKKPYNLIPDHVAFNFYPGWYGKFGELESQINAASKEAGKRVALSEYGAGSNPAQHEEGPLVQPKPKGPYHPEEWQTYVHETDWGLIKDNPHLWGSFLWVMFDFQVAGRNEGGQPHLNDKGMVTQDRKIKKDAYYLYQANWTDKPMVHIASSRMTPRRLADTSVEVFSNCDKVELIVNGKSQGTVTPDNIKVSRWPSVTLQPGPNNIQAIATSANGQLTDTCQWVLDPAAAPTPAGPETQFRPPTPTPSPAASPSPAQ